VVTDHDSQVLARRQVKAKATELGPVLAGARQVAHEHGFADVTVGCEPTGHRWRVLDQLAAQQGMALVCVCSRSWSGGLGRPRTTPGIKAMTRTRC
jgi:transposase